MTTAVVLYMFLALVQQHGTVGSGFGSLQACEDARAEVMGDAATLAVSPCLEVKLSPLSPAAKHTT